MDLGAMVTLPEVQQYIDGRIEESLTLEYKAAAALGRTDKHKDEITKDVSAIANAAGGRLIYGIKEFDERDRAHLPQRLDPISRTEYSKEWLDQVIDQVRPRIDGVIIHPIAVDPSFPDQVVYVIDIPQASTAHQARDHRYYKRRNFRVVPMEDYEVRDTMARSAEPAIDIELQIAIEEWEAQQIAFPATTKSHRRVTLEVYARNNGKRLARFVNGVITIPAWLDHESRSIAHPMDLETGATRQSSFENTRRDVVDVALGMPGVTPSVNKYGPSWYAPILPGRARRVSTINLPSGLKRELLGDEILEWKVYADNAPPREGVIRLQDTEWVAVE